MPDHLKGGVSSAPAKAAPAPARRPPSAADAP